jgi:RNA polymerase sigma factor (sigma-70 family)
VVALSEAVWARNQDRRAAVTASALGFESFFETEHAPLFRLMVLVTGSVQEAEDIVQDSFLALWERWERVATLENPIGYLHRTAMNTFRSRYRHAVFAAKRLLRLSGDAPDLIAGVETRDAALRMLLRLTRRQRAAVVLTELLGYSVDEAATVLSIRPGTVRTLVSQARARVAGQGGDPHE